MVIIFVTTKVEESARAMAAEGKTKALTTPLRSQDDFQQQNCTVGSLHDSDGWEVFYLLLLARGNRTPGSSCNAGCDSPSIAVRSN